MLKVTIRNKIHVHNLVDNFSNFSHVHNFFVENRDIHSLYTAYSQVPVDNECSTSVRKDSFYFFKQVF